MKPEEEADDFDADLYRLMRRAERNAERSVPVLRAKWTAARWKLSDARLHIREMMTEKDRAATR